MIDISRLFFIQFMDKDISRLELRSFVEDFLKKLAVQNAGGKYTAMLNATLAAYEAYFGALANLDVKNAIQQSRTGSMNQTMEAFQKGIQSSGRIIEGNFFGKPELQEFFPLGKAEYSSATLQNIEILMKRMFAAVEKYVTIVGDPIREEFKKYWEDFKAARGDQQTQIAQVGDARKDTEEARLALATLMTENVLDIAKANIGNPEAAKLFFNQSLLEDRNTPQEEPPVNPA